MFSKITSQYHVKKAEFEIKAKFKMARNKISSYEYYLFSKNG